MHHPRRLSPVRDVFVDTSAFAAVAADNDNRHADALALLNELTSAHARLFTTNLVLVETHALVLARLRRPDLAARIITELYNSKQTLLVRATEADERRALAILTRYQDKTFSFTDTTSFAVMERLGIQHAFSFDSDFQQYGWVVLQPPTR